MNKRATRTTIIILVLVMALVGYYAYLSNRNKVSRQDDTVTAVQNALSRDLERDYPPTPKEVVKYYNELFTCLYNEECTDEDIEALGLKARELYDAQLLEANEVASYLMRLQSEVKAGRDNQRCITSASVASSTNVDFFQQDGYEFAKLQCSYNILDAGKKYATTQMYLLRKDGNKRWKIYGWEDVKNLQSQPE